MPINLDPTSANDAVPAGYGEWLEDVKARIARARARAAVSVNAELVRLYWELGQDLLARQAKLGWGAKVVERLSHDLTAAFPGRAGFSVRNLRYMRAFALAWPDAGFVQEVLAQLPWSHQIALLDRLNEPTDRVWYAQAGIEHGWSRNVLVHQIDTRLHKRSGAAITNFTATLPTPHAELAQQLTRDPHVFDFLDLGSTFQERELEDALVGQLQRFLLELGKGFAFVGRQYHLAVGGQDYYVDLLFYHLKLHCYIVIELKVDDFKPEYVGKMQFYLAALDDQVKTELDGPSIGMILCRSKNAVVVEYSLRDATKPLGVSEYRVGLPQQLAAALPSPDELRSAMRVRTPEAGSNAHLKD
jgi:predicted nuclease of restriction endonuclease-like (RecB) superfamily